jgi:formate dehydrogenase major subunit
MLEQFQSTNQTGRGERIWREAPNWFVEVSPEVAAAQGIEDGDWVKLTSRRGSAEMIALVTDRVRGNTLFLPIHQGKSGVNEMTGEHHDPDVNTPAYKETAVKLERLPHPPGHAREAPLPPNNYRNHARTPNAGIDATAKWARPDYALPPATIAHPENL